MGGGVMALSLPLCEVAGCFTAGTMAAGHSGRLRVTMETEAAAQRVSGLKTRSEKRVET